MIDISKKRSVAERAILANAVGGSPKIDAGGTIFFAISIVMAGLVAVIC